jgi:hypothetical protein
VLDFELCQLVLDHRPVDVAMWRWGASEVGQHGRVMCFVLMAF